MTALHIPTDDMPLGERIRLARQKFRWSQETLADKLNRLVGRDDYNQSEISRWEAGKRPDPIAAVNLARVLQLPLGYFGDDYVEEWNRLLGQWEVLQRTGGYGAFLTQPVPIAA